MTKRFIALTVCFLIITASMVYTAAVNIESPKDLTVEVKSNEDGIPYFELKFSVPEAVKNILENSSKDEEVVFYMAEYQIGSGEWQQTGSVDASNGNTITINPEDMGINGNIDIKANVYNFRVKADYFHYEVNDEHGNRVATDTSSSPYSNIASTAIKGFQKSYKDASEWAVPELDKADEYGFITDKIKDKMNGPITREEFAEVAIKLYEKMFGKEASYQDTTAFNDTKNPEIYKAFELGIVNGVGNNKFAPNELTNREQVAAMMNRAVKVVKPSADFSTNGIEKFTDEKQISPWALDPVKFMNKNGFIKGVGGGNIAPKGTTTREQAVIMVVRVYEKYGK